MSPRARIHRLALNARRQAPFATDRVWYAEQAQWLASVAHAHGLPLHVVRGVCAVLSPRVQWAGQRNGLEPFLVAERRKRGSGRHAGMRANIVKARRILAGEHPLAVLSGPKVRAFYGALKGDAHAIVVDTHMQAAAGVSGGLHRRSRYARIAGAIRESATRLGIAPAELQAAVWCHWRRLETSIPF